MLTNPGGTLIAKAPWPTTYLGKVVRYANVRIKNMTLCQPKFPRRPTWSSSKGKFRQVAAVTLCHYQVR